MDVKNKNRIGYKKTKVGWIPEDWACVTLSMIAEKGPQNGLYKQHHEYSGSCRMVHMPQIFSFDYINNQEMPVVEMSQRENHYLLKNGDLLFARRSLTIEGAGKCSLVQAHNGPITFESSIIRITPDKKSLHPEFAFYYIHSARGRYQMFTFTRVVAVSGIAGSDLKLYALPLPPLPEQEAIAGVLECWDKAIREYERKIEKKRNIKKGLMQRLLSGKQRLPGFDGEWEEVRMGDLYEITSSKRVFQSEWKTEGIPFYRAREIVALSENGLVDNELYISHAMYEEYKRKYGVPQTDDLLVTGVGTVGEVYRVKGDEEFYFKDGNIIWLKNKRVASSEYIEHAFKTRDIRRQVLGCSPITTVATYTIDAAKKTLVYLPPLQEQQAIASVLSEAGAEISALARKLAALQHQKRFLLNNLVTGTIRLPQFRGGGVSPNTNGDHT